MTDSTSNKIGAITTESWPGYIAERHADKLRQTRARLNDRVNICHEFGMDVYKLADEIARLRQELAGQGVAV